MGVTGSYAGTGIQYVVPAALVYFGRKVRRLASNFFKDFNMTRDYLNVSELKLFTRIRIRFSWFLYYYFSIDVTCAYLMFRRPERLWAWEWRISTPPPSAPSTGSFSCRCGRPRASSLLPGTTWPVSSRRLPQCSLESRKPDIIQWNHLLICCCDVSHY